VVNIILVATSLEVAWRAYVTACTCSKPWTEDFPNRGTSSPTLATCRRPLLLTRNIDVTHVIGHSKWQLNWLRAAMYAKLPRKNGEGNILLWSNQEGRERGMKYGLRISCFHPQLLKIRHQDPVRDLVRSIRQSDPRKEYTHIRKIPSYIIKQTTVSHMQK